MRVYATVDVVIVLIYAVIAAVVPVVDGTDPVVVIIIAVGNTVDVVCAGIVYVYVRDCVVNI